MFYKLCASLVFVLALSSPVQATEQGPVKIVATFSILGDMIQQVGGADVNVVTLVGPDEDAHSFQPSPEDVKKLVDAEIIAINGLKFEGWMHRLIKASGTKAKLLVTSAGIKPRLLQENEAHHEDADANHDRKGEINPDPHAWQDLRNGQLYARNIAAALIEARPDRAAQIKQHAQTYIDELGELDKTTREAFSTLPPDRRKIITSHDAFGYFAAAYGVRFLAPVGINTESEPSAADVAKLIEQVKRERVKTLFVENMTDPRLIQQIAKDTGAKVGGKLYADALSKPDGEAPTYLAMMKVNIERLITALK